MPALLKFEMPVSVRILKAAYEGVVFLEQTLQAKMHQQAVPNCKFNTSMVSCHSLTLEQALLRRCPKDTPGPTVRG